MRYFLTTVAHRPVKAGGRVFNFEPVALRGGSWLGVLALDEESGANILSSADHPSVSEITQEHYESEKKNLQSSTASWDGHPPVQTPRALVGPSVVVPAGRLTDPILGTNLPGSGPGQPVTAPDPNSTSGISAVTLMTTKLSPPSDPLLAENTQRFRMGR